jgi:hypothetical protein
MKVLDSLLVFFFGRTVISFVVREHPSDVLYRLVEPRQLSDEPEPPTSPRIYRTERASKQLYRYEDSRDDRQDDRGQHGSQNIDNWT